MGTTAEKINRLTQTKLDLKTVINYTGANITDETTFKEYPKLLNKAYIDILNDNGESLYNALPKTTGTGSNLTLNTEKGKMKISLNSTELTQNGTPTPENPVDINVVTGEQNVKIVGKNLFDEDNMSVLNGYIWQNRMVLRDTLTDRIFYIPCQPNTTYTISRSVLTSSFRVATYNDTIPTVTSERLVYTCYNEINNNDGTTITITTDTNSKYLLVMYANSVNDTNIEESLATIQVEKGSQATEYVEHQEQNYPISLSSKNLVDIPDITLSGTGYVINQSNLAIPNGTYTLTIQESPYSSFSVNIQDMNGTPYFNATKTLPLTIEATNGIKLIRVYSTSTTGGTFGKIQLEEGNTATPYTPYIANPLEYCKIGDYADQIFKNTTDSEFYDSTLVDGEWYLKKNIGKVSFVGADSEVYEKMYGGIFNNRCMFYLKNMPHNNSSYELMKSNRFIATAGATEYYAEGINVSYNSNQFVLNIMADKLTEYTTTALRTFFQNNNTNVYYVLSTPTYIHITETDYPVLYPQLENIYNNAKSYNGQTNITQTNDGLSFTLVIKALAKIE